MFDDARDRTPSLPGVHGPMLHRMAALGVWIVVWIALWRLAAALAVNYGISAWYPPAAISLFVMIRYGAMATPAIFVASLLAGSAQWQGYPGHFEVLGSLGHAGAYLAAAELYRRLQRTHRHSMRGSAIIALMPAILLGSLTSAIVGNLNIYVASGGEYSADFERILSWAVGDLFGALTLCPILLFVGIHLRWSRTGTRHLIRAVRTPLAGLVVALALTGSFALISSGSDLNFRVVAVVGIGVYSVIVACVVSPRSAVIYLFLIAVLSAAWLSTEMAPGERVEFAVQISTFLIASFAMIHLMMGKMRARVAVINRRLRIRELSEQRDALSRRVRAIEAEFAQLAHEFKTPLGGILGLLKLTEGGLASGEGAEEITRYFSYMRSCALYLSAMVDDAFDVARIARGQFAPVIADFDMVALLQDLALISRTKGDAEVSAPAGFGAAGLIVRSDRNRLLQILINLVVNAVRYADQPGSVRVCCSVTAATATVTVRNAASAVTKAQLDAHIEGGVGPSKNSKGLGIGLPLVRRLADGIGAQLATEVADGVVTVSVTVARV